MDLSPILIKYKSVEGPLNALLINATFDFFNACSEAFFVI